MGNPPSWCSRAWARRLCDEVDVHLNPKIGRDWMLRGQQRRTVTPGKNKKFYLAGGFIDVESELGRGTTFSLYLPRHSGPTDQSAGTAVRPAIRGHETILLVEDELAILKVTKQMLEGLGSKVLAASTAGEAIRLAKENSDVHLLLTDVIMPDMNGRDLANNLLALYPSLKRIFMSGYTADVLAQHGVADDRLNFIQKPFTKADLAAKIRETLDGKPLN